MTSEFDDYKYWSSKIDSATSEKELQLFRIMRMKAMMTYPSKEQFAQKLMEKQTEKCILFCNTINQAHKLSTHSYTSKNSKSNDNLELFKQGKINKISCVLQLSEGINVPNLKIGIIMHSFNNERKLIQRFGRLCRLNPEEIATLHVLCYSNTIDENWCSSALSDLDQTKIIYQ